MWLSCCWLWIDTLKVQSETFGRFVALRKNIVTLRLACVSIRLLIHREKHVDP
jgi:hypothetical protein